MIPLTQKLNSSKVLVIGPCPETYLNKSYLDEKRSEGYSIVSFSCSSLIFLYDIGFVPDFHAFIDPQSYCRVGLKTGIKFLNQIHYIGYSHLANYPTLLSSNKNIFGSSRFGITDFLSNKEYTDFFKRYPPFNSYYSFLNQEASMVNAESPNTKIDINFSKKLYRLYSGKSEIDKLTYFMIPLILFFFKNLSNLNIYGFGYFQNQRYSGGTKTSYPKYKNAFKKILPLYRGPAFNKNIILSIDKSSFYSELSSLKNC